MSTYVTTERAIICQFVYFPHNKKTKEVIFDVDIFNENLRNFKEMGLENWLRSRGSSKEAYLRKLNKSHNFIKPITHLVIKESEYSTHEESREETD